MMVANEQASVAPVAGPSGFGHVARFAMATVGSAILWAQLALLILVVGLGVYSGHRPILIEGQSMGKSIPPGHVVIIRDPDPEGPMVGRVVTFQARDRYITHRITGEPEPGEYTTQGDASTSPDPDTLSIDEMEGVGHSIIPAIGLPLLWINNGKWVHMGTWFAVTIMAGVFVVAGKSNQDDDDAVPAEGRTGAGDETPTPVPSTPQPVLWPLDVPRPLDAPLPIGTSVVPAVPMWSIDTRRPISMHPDAVGTYRLGRDDDAPADAIGAHGAAYRAADPGTRRFA